LIIYYNRAGQIVYSKAYELTNTTENSLLKESNRFFKENDLLCRFSSDRDEKRGIVPASENLFLVASRPIVKSDGMGPVLGVVLMGKLLTLDRIADLERRTHLDLTIVTSHTKNLPLGFQEAKNQLSDNAGIYVQPVNSSVVSGYAPLIDVFGYQCGILGVDVPRRVYQQGVNTTNTYTLVMIVGSIAFASTAFLILEKAFLSRVANLTKAVTKITHEEDITQRIPLRKQKSGKTNSDELSLLAKSINHMLEKIQEVTASLNAAQRFATIGELSAMIAHDLRNPLQGITLATDYLRREKTNNSEKKTRMLDIIDDDVEYCEKIVSDLLDYSREIKVFPTKTGVKTLVSSALSHIQVPEAVQINDLTQDTVELAVDKDKMVRVFDNLIKNSIDAMLEGGSLTIKSKVVGKQVRISFEDTGKGITKEDMKKLFTPLFTTKAKGMGFGLAICKRIIEAHNGTISVKSIHNKGTKFTLELPT
jgi:signal transduction histidine kinase